MSWLQLQLSTTPQQAHILEGLMESAGAISVTMLDAQDQPLFEPGPGETPLWNSILLTALFPESFNSQDIITQLKHKASPEALPEITVETLAEQNWQRAWMDDFAPTLFGKRLWICPSWCDVPEPDDVTIMLDPGLAFGTGTHPTTALCLRWLDSHPLQGQSLIDYGCGSGILGIATLLLGAKKVIGVDNDPQALIATKDNCHKNNISLESFPTAMPNAFITEVTSGHINQADGLLANILAGPLIELAHYLSALVKPKGWILLSGILAEQAEEVSSHYRPWFDMDEPVIDDGWARLTGTRKKN